MKLRFVKYCFVLFLVVVIADIGAFSQEVAQTSQPPSSLSSQQKSEVQKIIGDYLRENPEIVVEAIRILQERERRREQNAGRANLVTYRELIQNDPTSPVGGNPKGDVTIVEFFDYNCHFCKKVFPTVKKLLKEDKNIRYVFKEFPILSPQSEMAARVALAAHRQNKSNYVQLHTEIIELHGGMTQSRILRLARKFGYDTEKLKKDMSSSEIDSIINGNRQLAQQLGITGTPGFIIGNKIVPGAIDLNTFKQMVADARKG